MTATANVTAPSRVRVSKGKFRIILISSILLVTAIFLLTYFFGKDITRPFFNSPTLLKPSPPTYVFSIYGQGSEGQFKKPMSVTVVNSKVYVTDTDNRRVQVFDTNGKFLFRFGKEGKDKGQFQFPYGIAADGTGNVYVADMWAGNIQVFTEDGKFVKYFPDEKSAANETVGSPASLYYLNGRLYEADLKTNSVKVFDTATGKKLFEAGKGGTKGVKKDGELLAPNGVVATADYIYVSDTYNDRIQVFSAADGKFVSKMDGSDDGGNAKALAVRGIGIDGRNVLYTSSLMGNYVAGFTTKGEYLWVFGGQGQDDGQFSFPNGLFVDNQGRIYVTDQANNRVSVWEN